MRPRAVPDNPLRTLKSVAADLTLYSWRDQPPNHLLMIQRRAENALAAGKGPMELMPARSELTPCTHLQLRHWQDLFWSAQLKPVALNVQLMLAQGLFKENLQ